MRHESHVVIDPGKLRTALNRRGMSAATLAAEAGITPGTLSGYTETFKATREKRARTIVNSVASENLKVERGNAVYEIELPKIEVRLLT